MIYTPGRHPKQAMIIVAAVSILGIIAGLFIHEFFMVAALIFWMHYTAILSYLQFKKKTKHKWKTFTESLLHPQLRFFIFEFMAAVGLFAILKSDWLAVGASALLVWFLFSLNFYVYYGKFRKYE